METGQVAGHVRVTKKRVMGGVAFLECRFDGTFAQLLCERKTLPNFNSAAGVQLGSILEIKGHWGKSRNGTDVIVIDQLKAVTTPSKTYPLPENTSVDADRLSLLLADDHALNGFQAYSEITSGLRSAFLGNGYREYPTGILQPEFESGTARPFLTRCNADGADYALALTSEIKLKQLLAAGEGKVFEIFQSFRNEGVDQAHSPEFTLLEAYEAGGSLESMADCLEASLRLAAASAKRVALKPERWETLDQPFERLEYARVCEGIMGIAAEDVTLDRLCGLYPESFREGMSAFTWTFKFINRYIAPKLERPTFLTGLPSNLSPLVKASKTDPRYAERASLLIRGVDVADVYVDETNAATVTRALLEQSKATGKEPNRKLIELLAYGMPPSAGVGMGLNRLFMALDKRAPSIRDTIIFPFYGA